MDDAVPAGRAILLRPGEFEMRFVFAMNARTMIFFQRPPRTVGATSVAGLASPCDLIKLVHQATLE
jgi:hypothetical protein